MAGARQRVGGTSEEREGGLPVALLDLILSGIRLDIEQVVQLSFLHHGCGFSYVWEEG